VQSVVDSDMIVEIEKKWAKPNIIYRNKQITLKGKCF
jgi:hypothetical protein